MIRKNYQAFNKEHCKLISSQDNTRFILYKGLSMSSTLKDMDVLYYVPGKRVRPGDVVVIKISDYEDRVIHRVISIDKRGIRTMGDFNPYPDNWFLKPGQILGRVVYGYRGKKRFRVHGGLAGLAQMSQVRMKYFIFKVSDLVLNTIFCNSIIHLKMPIIKPQCIAFIRPNGTELQLIALGKVIGRQLPGQSWQIKFPFRYFLHSEDFSD